MKLNIFVLHHLGDPTRWRQSMFEKELCLPHFAPEHNYVVHDFELPLPSYVADMAFDAIILTQTFLSKRQDPTFRRRLHEVYGVVGSMPAFKIALPQDDYTCNAILDEWMVDWKVDVVFPVCVNDWGTLYPKYSKVGRLRQGYTGYINEQLIQRTETRLPISKRLVDVAYRGSHLSPKYGRLGYNKSVFGERFVARAQGSNLSMDISTQPKDTITGTRWYDFIENARCMLGVNSGASLMDPVGEINLSVFRYLQRYPKASFEEVEAACFPGLDGKFEFTAISPRNIECALLGAVQVLAPGPYGGLMTAKEHYIPLESDMSNFDEVLPLLRDHHYLQKLADRCREVLLSYPELRYTTHVEELLEEVQRHSRLTDSERQGSAPLFARYCKDMVKIKKLFWRKKRIVSKTRETMAGLGARRTKYFLKDLFGK